MSFPISDKMICEFLAQNGYIWDKKVLDFNRNWIESNCNDFLEHKNGEILVGTIILNGEDENKIIPLNRMMSFSKSSFTICKLFLGNPEKEKDLSIEWIKYLYKKYGKEYHNYLNKLCDDKIRNAKEKYEQEKNRLFKQLGSISKEYENVLLKYETIKNTLQIK